MQYVDAFVAAVPTAAKQAYLDETNPMPFDGSRLIYGGFQTLLDA